MSGEQRTPWLVEQDWEITYQHNTDEVTATFLRTLRDEGRLLGRRCPRCRRVLLPPSSLCSLDLCPTDEWVELPLTGVLRNSTIVCREIRGLPDPPYALAHVQVDGADTALGGFLHGLDLADPERALEALEPGRRVELVLSEQPIGRITDLHFRLAGD